MSLGEGGRKTVQKLNGCPIPAAEYRTIFIRLDKTPEHDGRTKRQICRSNTV